MWQQARLLLCAISLLLPPYCSPHGLQFAPLGPDLLQTRLRKRQLMAPEQLKSNELEGESCPLPCTVARRSSWYRRIGGSVRRGHFLAGLLWEGKTRARDRVGGTGWPVLEKQSVSGLENAKV